MDQIYVAFSEYLNFKKYVFISHESKADKTFFFWKKPNTKSKKAILLLKVVKCISENKNKNHIDSNACNAHC